MKTRHGRIKKLLRLYLKYKKTKDWLGYFRKLIFSRSIIPLSYFRIVYIHNTHFFVCGLKILWQIWKISKILQLFRISRMLTGGSEIFIIRKSDVIEIDLSHCLPERNRTIILKIERIFFNAYPAFTKRMRYLLTDFLHSLHKIPINNSSFCKSLKEHWSKFLGKLLTVCCFFSRGIPLGQGKKHKNGFLPVSSFSLH